MCINLTCNVIIIIRVSVDGYYCLLAQYKEFDYNILFKYNRYVKYFVYNNIISYIKCKQLFNNDKNKMFYKSVAFNPF